MTLPAEHGAMGEVGSPVDLAPDPVDASRAGAWTGGVIAVATAVLLLLNAHALGGWFDDLPPSRTSERLAPAVAGIVGVTARSGLDAPRAALRARWQAAKSVRFGQEQAGEAGSGDAE